LLGLGLTSVIVTLTRATDSLLFNASLRLCKAFSMLYIEPYPFLQPVRSVLCLYFSILLSVCQYLFQNIFRNAWRFPDKSKKRFRRFPGDRTRQTIYIGGGSSADTTYCVIENGTQQHIVVNPNLQQLLTLS
jgi:hypothetical protein